MKLNQNIDRVADRYHVTTTIAGTSAAEDQLISDHGEPIIEVGGQFTDDVTRPGETAPVVAVSPAHGAVVSANVVNGEITSYTVDTAGTGQTTRPSVGITGGGGSAATATATLKAVGVSVATGGTTSYRALSVVLVAPGATYIQDELITLAGGTGTTATVIKVLTVDAGAVGTYEIATAGKYSVVPPNTVAQDFASAAGVGATFDVTWETFADYAPSDTIVLAGGTKTTAVTLTVGAVTNGVITAATITVAGSYTALPANAVAQDTSNGNGAGATFTVAWGVNTVDVDDLGSGYFLVPTPIDFTFPSKQRRLITDFPDKRVFDLADDVNADLMAKVYSDTIEARIVAALATLRAKTNPFEGETTSTI